MQRCRLYLISPPTIDLPVFTQQVKEAFQGGDIGALQLRLKNTTDSEILKATDALLPICRDHGAAFIMNDRPDLALQCNADGVHLGQDDLLTFPSPLMGEGQGGGDAQSANNTPHLGSPKDLSKAKPKATRPLPQGERRKGNSSLAVVREMIGSDRVIGISCHDSRHLAMVAGEQGADYVAFGAFYPTTSKSPEALQRWGTPKLDILEWWQAFMILPCVAIGGINPQNCKPLVKAGADFIAVITAVWNHPEGPSKAVEEFNKAIKEAI